MTGLDLDRDDDRSAEDLTRHPKLYVIVEVALLAVLGVLIYGLVKLA